MPGEERERRGDVDAIVVLGCRILTSGRLTAPAARRAATAAEAYLSGVAEIVIASGGRRWGSQIEARALQAELVRGGVPAGAIMQELWSLTTCENAIFSAALLRRIGARRAAVVTCPWHMRRALMNFREAGVDAIALPTRPPPAGPLLRAWRYGHELVCERLDARTIRRPSVLRDSAAGLSSRLVEAAALAEPVEPAEETEPVEPAGRDSLWRGGA